MNFEQNNFASKAGDDQLYWEDMTITSLLAKINSPAFIFECETGKIIQNNRKILDLFNFDIAIENVYNLFQDYSLPSNLIHKSTQICTFREHSVSSEEVLVETSFIDSKRCFALLVILSKSANHQGDNYQISINEFANQLNSILHIQSEDNFRTTLKQILIKAKVFLQIDHIGVYHALSNKTSLVKIAVLDSANLFPDELPAKDLYSLLTQQYWLSEMKPITKIHRRAFEAEYKLIGSVSLGGEKALLGVIIVVGKVVLQKEIFLTKLKLVSTIVNLYLEQFILVDNLQSKLAKQAEFDKFRSRFFDQSQEGVVFIDKSLRVFDINTAAEIMLGFTLEEVTGQLVENVLVGAEGLMDAIYAAGAGIETKELGNVKLHRRNGQAFATQIRTIPGYSTNETVDGIAIIISDESENEQNRIRVQHLEQRAALGELSAVFAHEVKNPINNIFTGMQLLKSKLSEDDLNLDIVDRILKDCSRLTNLMESTLAFSKPIEPKLRPMEIYILIASLLDRWRPRLERLKISASIHKPDFIPKVIGDYRLLEQVFTNLISNAVDIMELTGGLLNIRISISEINSGPPSLEIAVSDTGPGIPEDIIDKIFEPFVSSKHKGTGLGLAITKQIVTAQRGNIHVSSFPGGSIFYVNLPIYQGD